MKVCILRSPTKAGYIFIHKVDQSLCPCLTNLVLGAVGILDSPCLSVRHPYDTVWRKIYCLGKSIFYDFYTKHWSKILVDHWYTLSSYCICYYNILLFSFHFLLMHCLPITLIFWLCTLAFKTWGPPGFCWPQMGPWWPLKPCYQGWYQAHTGVLSLGRCTLG